MGTCTCSQVSSYLSKKSLVWRRFRSPVSEGITYTESFGMQPLERSWSVIVGHLPRKISRICTLFIRRGGAIHCRVTGRRKYSTDLPQGGVDIPCLLLFEGEAKEIKKLVKLISKKWHHYYNTMYTHVLKYYQLNTSGYSVKSNYNTMIVSSLVSLS